MLDNFQHALEDMHQERQMQRSQTGDSKLFSSSNNSIQHGKIEIETNIYIAQLHRKI